MPQGPRGCCGPFDGDWWFSAVELTFFIPGAFTVLMGQATDHAGTKVGFWCGGVSKRSYVAAADGASEYSRAAPRNTQLGVHASADPNLGPNPRRAMCAMRAAHRQHAKHQI